MKENDKTSHRAELMRDIVAMVNQNPVLKQAWQRKKEKSIQNTEFEYPEHLSVEHIDMGLFKMEYLTWNGSENPYVILQLHGGGYMSGLQGQYRKMAGLYAEISSGAAVLSVDYRLAPEYPFPAALEDAVAAYKWLRDKGYESDRIIVVGDSAGGGLAMALCMELRTNGEPMPAGLVAMSPWTDLAITGESYTKNREAVVRQQPYYYIHVFYKKSSAPSSSSSSSAARTSMPRGGTGVENTICVSVFPYFWSCPMKVSSSIVLGKHTLINMEYAPVTQLHSKTFGHAWING